jgi:hypothetical protein
MADAWNGLLGRSAASSLFLTHEWMAGWLKASGDARDELYVLTAGEGVDAIAPFVRRRVPGTGLVKLELLTMGEYAYAPSNLSGSLDFIADRDRGPEAVDTILGYLSDHRNDWDYLRLHPVPEASPTVRRLIEWSRRSGFRCSVRRVFTNAVIPLPETTDAYLARLTPHFRKTLRRIGNLVGREAGVRVTEVTSAADVGGAFEEMVGIERRSWKHRGGLSLETSSVRGFYERQAAAAARTGALTIWFLEVGGRRVAYDLGIVHGDRIEILKGSYDREFARLSPGAYLTLREIEAFIGRGLRSVDLLWGDLAYKTRWAAVEEPCCELYVCNRGAAGGIVYWAYVASGLYRAIRYLRNLSGRRSE